MRIKNVLPVLFALVTIGAVSCQKEVDYADLGDDPNNPGAPNPGGPGSNPSTSDKSIVGDWKFVKMTAAIQAMTEMSISGTTSRSLINTTVTSINEGGFLYVTDTKMKADGITYSGNYSGSISTYSGNVLANTQPMPPSSFFQAPDGQEVTYNRIGNDSIRVSAPLVAMDVPGVDLTTFPLGGTVGWLGDTLVLTSHINEAQEDNSIPTVSIKSTTVGTQVIKFVKK